LRKQFYIVSVMK